MEAIFSSARGVSGADVLLSQLQQDRLPPLEVLGRIAAFHQGQPAGLVPFRTAFIATANQHYPAPDDVNGLLALLMAATRSLFDEAKSPRDDLYVAAHLLWGLTAVHPFADGNGRTAADFTRYVLLGRWNLAAAPFTHSERLVQQLEPVLMALDTPNDGSAEGYVRQLAALGTAFGTVTLEKLKSNQHFEVLARGLSAAIEASSAA
jgi:hypothetical protein